MRLLMAVPEASRSPAETSCGRRARGYASLVPTLVLDPAAYEIEALLERRRRSGVDRFDEVWGGRIRSR